MNIKFDTQELVNALNKASKAFPTKGAVRLELVEAKGKYRMNVIAYNEVDLQVHTVLKVTVDEFKSTVLTVDGRKLLEAVNALRALGSAVELNVRETDIQVVCGENHISLPLFGEAAKVLPQIEEGPTLILSLNGETLGAGISKVAFGTMDNPAGKERDGLYLELSGNGQLVTVSTLCDHFGATTALPVKPLMVNGEKVGEDMSVAMPNGEKVELTEALKGVISNAFLPRCVCNIASQFSEECVIYFFEKKLVIQSGFDGYFVGLKEAKFAKPLFGQVMAAVMNPENCKLQVKKGALINALKITAIGADSENGKVPVVLTQNGKTLVLVDLNGQAKTNIETESESTLMEERLFSGKNMLTCIAGAGEDVVLSFPDGTMNGMAGISSVGDAFTQVFIILARRPKEE